MGRRGSLHSFLDTFSHSLSLFSLYFYYISCSRVYESGSSSGISLFYIPLFQMGIFGLGPVFIVGDV